LVCYVHVVLGLLSSGSASPVHAAFFLVLGAFVFAFCSPVFVTHRPCCMSVRHQFPSGDHGGEMRLCMRCGSVCPLICSNPFRSVYACRHADIHGRLGIQINVKEHPSTQVPFLPGLSRCSFILPPFKASFAFPEPLCSLSLLLAVRARTRAHALLPSLPPALFFYESVSLPLLVSPYLLRPTPGGLCAPNEHQKKLAQ
jgi:hypothetical protein